MNLQDETNRVHEVLENLPDGVLIVDADGIVRFANLQTQKLFGYEPAELIGRPIELLVPEHVRHSHVNLRNTYAQQPHTRPMGADLNLSAVRKDGSTFPVNVSLSPHRDDNDLHIICAVRDASRQKEVERTLRRQHMHLELLHLATQVANDADSADDAIQTVIDQICSYLGLDVGHAFVSTFAEEVRSYSIKRSWHLSDPARFIPFRDASQEISFLIGVGLPGQVMQSAQPQWVDDVLRRDDYIRRDVARKVGLRTGIFVPLLIQQHVAAVMEFYSTNVLPRDEELLDILVQIGTILGRVVERKQAREKFEREAYSHRQILDAVGDGILIVNRTGEVTFANEQALTYFEASASEIVGANIGDVPRWSVEKAFDDFPAPGHPLHEVFERAEPYFDMEVRVFRPRLGTIDLSFNLAPIHSSSGTVEKAVLSIRDITARNRAQQLLRGQRHVLELVARGATHTEVGQGLINLIEDQVGMAACILFSRSDCGQSLEMIAAPSFPNEMRERIQRISIADEDLPCATAARTGEPAIMHVSEANAPSAFKEVLESLNVCSCWSFPVHSNSGELLGVFSMYHRTPREPTDSDREVIETAVGLAQIAFERIRAERQLATQAFYDGLTGLPNRSLLMDRIKQALRRSSRTEVEVALMFLDLDEFKSVNDSLGHHAGDEFLIAVAQRLQRAIRSEDTVARFAGDEFVVLLETIEQRDDALEIARRIQHELRDPLEVAGIAVYATCSIGIAFNDRSPPDADGLLRDADKAMYRSKSRGRGEIAVFAETRD